MYIGFFEFYITGNSVQRFSFSAETGLCVCVCAHVKNSIVSNFSNHLNQKCPNADCPEIFSCGQFVLYIYLLLDHFMSKFQVCL